MSKAAALYGALAPFTEALKHAPHRDATHVPYSQWFRLYVALRKGVATSRDGARLLAQAKAAVDTALLSSLLAEHWRQVMLPLDLKGDGNTGTDDPGAPSTRGHHAGTPSTLWYANGSRALDMGKPPSGDGMFENHALTFPSLKERQDGGEGGSPVCFGSSVELLSPNFLAEPLAGGAALAAWTHELRLCAAAAATASGALDKRLPPVRAPVFHVCLPFSTLFQLKYEAHVRLGSSAASETTNEHPATGAATLSLQDRRARRTLLQSIHQLLQIHHDVKHPAAARDNANRTRGIPCLVQLHAWTPTQEFDMLCDLPRLRPTLLDEHPGTELSKSSGKEEEGATSASSHLQAEALSLRAVCESAPARLAYLARYATHRGTQAVAAADAPPMPVALLTHGAELRAMRALGVPLLRERSHWEAWREQLTHQVTASLAGAEKSAVPDALLARLLASLDGDRRRAARPASRAHQQALRGCGDLVRRMTSREENIRQSFSQH